MVRVLDSWVAGPTKPRSIRQLDSDASLRISDVAPPIRA